MALSKENPVQSGVPEIVLAKDLKSIDEFIAKARNGFEEVKTGSTILFQSENGKFTSITYINQEAHDKQPIGFWVSEGEKNGDEESGGTIRNSAIIFEEESVTLVHLGSPKDQVSGIKIGHNHRAEKFSGPLDQFPQIIKDAKKQAQDSCKRKLQLF
jgi:hypothetical protein